MRDFLSECKNIFHMESDLANENEITGIVEDNLIEYNYDGVYGPIPDPETGMVDLYNYASKYIPDYKTITEIPENNLKYLKSGLIASNMGSSFLNCEELLEMPDLKIDTSKCKNFINLFFDCKKIQNINLNWLDTKNGEIRAMFRGCESITNLDLTNIDTSSTTTFYCLFNMCYELVSLNVNNLNTSNVTNMNETFSDCRKLASLNLNNWNTSNVTNMNHMFRNCYSLVSLDLSSFDTNNVTDMYGMFDRCRSLTTLNLSNFDTSRVSDMRLIFGGLNPDSFPESANKLEFIDGVFDLNSAKNILPNANQPGYLYMFNCPKLSGVKIKNPPQAYYDNKEQFESDIGLTSDQYEIVS